MANESYYLAIDVGNTKTAAGLFLDNRLISSAKVATPELNLPVEFKKCLEQLFQQTTPIAKSEIKVGVASVVPEKNALVQQVLKEIGCQVPAFLSSQMALPFENRYDTPQTLGIDRLALAACAYDYFPNQAAIIIDFGTAITYDILTSKPAYLGGLILAGPQIISECLHEKTAQLPIVSLEHQSTLIGGNTDDCLKRGLYWGLMAQTRGIIAELKADLKENHQEEDCKVILTGGYHEVIDGHLPGIDIKDPVAVLRGIKVILAYNNVGSHKKV
jgi:type III pantothenate kinase